MEMSSDKAIHSYIVVKYYLCFVWKKNKNEEKERKKTQTWLYQVYP